MAGATYKCKYRNADPSLEEKVRKYCEYYNEEIDFPEYYYKINNCKLGHDGKDKCKLHDEVNGESFSYSRASKIWSCWGSCKTTAAGVVEYHMMYLRKTKPYISTIDALKSLQSMYPQLPKFEYTQKKRIRDDSGTNLNRLKNKMQKYRMSKETTYEQKKLSYVEDMTDDINRLCFFCFTHNYIDRGEVQKDGN